MGMFAPIASQYGNHPDEVNQDSIPGTLITEFNDAAKGVVGFKAATSLSLVGTRFASGPIKVTFSSTAGESKTGVVRTRVKMSQTYQNSATDPVKTFNVDIEVRGADDEFVANYGAFDALTQILSTSVGSALLSLGDVG